MLVCNHCTIFLVILLASSAALHYCNPVSSTGSNSAQGEQSRVGVECGSQRGRHNPPEQGVYVGSRRAAVVGRRSREIDTESHHRGGWVVINWVAAVDFAPSRLCAGR